MDNVLEAATFHELATAVEERAERVLGHAYRARQHAEHHASQNAIQETYLREAHVHERTAAVLKSTAALYRARALAITPTRTPY